MRVVYLRTRMLDDFESTRDDLIVTETTEQLVMDSIKKAVRQAQADLKRGFYNLRIKKGSRVLLNQAAIRARSKR